MIFLVMSDNFVGLFLGAGNIMHSMNDKLDITKMGGLFHHLKNTAILMIIASISLAGIYPFAGFFSKDKILEVAFISNNYLLWIVLLVSAFYSFRLLMFVFFVPKNHTEHIHKTPKIMLISMIPLALLAIFAHCVVLFLRYLFIKKELIL